MLDMDYVLHSFGFGLYMLEKVGIDTSSADEKGQLRALESSGIRPVGLLVDSVDLARLYVIGDEGRVPCAMELEAFGQNLPRLNASIEACHDARTADAFTSRLSEFRAAALLRAT